MNSAIDNNVLAHDALIESLRDPLAYVHSVTGPVVLHETHISWVLLAGNFAYKIKKPIVTDFLDYGTLPKRHHACCEELRLGNRYATGLYLDVVPVTFEDGQIRMDGDAQPIEFAVRMRRFPENALLSRQLRENLVTREHMIQLASSIAGFHAVAWRLDRPAGEIVSRVFDQAKENFNFLLGEPLLQLDPMLLRLESWTTAFFKSYQSQFRSRMFDGFIRECHGDLHCDNVVFWAGLWVPFDGIEFNFEYSRIDVSSDVSFLIMDLDERGHADLSAIFLNAYLEQTGDYRSLLVLRWYLVYRAMVRAKIAVMRARQLNQVQRLDSEQMAPAREYIQLANRMIKPVKRHLWITHGVSGSGKTTASQRIIEKEGAVRIRSDVERKRLFKTSGTTQSGNEPGEGMYSPTASEATYRRLFDVAKDILRADFPVVVDATFLKQSDRRRFQMLANSEGADFRIVDFPLDEETLKKRITHRRLTQNDASDATLAILANQLLTQQPLTADELEVTIDGSNY